MSAISTGDGPAVAAGTGSPESPAMPCPVSPRAPARSVYLLHHLLEPHAGYRRLAAWLEARPGQSSWIRYWQGLDDDLWADADGRPASA